MKDAYLRDPFYGNSEALLKILRDVGYDMPKDYLNNLDIYGNYTGSNKDYGKKISEPTIREIPIKAWVWRNDDGSGNINLAQVKQLIGILNQLFTNNTNIRFYLLCDITEINNSNVTNNGDAHFEDICLLNKESGAINVHFIISSNSNWGGKAHFPDALNPGLRYTCVVGEYNITAMGSTLAHEIGHTLGLYHTHNAGRSWSHSNNSGCGDCHQESVSRSKRQELGCIGTYQRLKCEVNGDFLCDTAADPELSGSLVNYNLCNYTSSNTDNWGVVWTPNVQNIMSYSYYTCRNYFSPLQVGKMNYYYSQIGVNYPFYSMNGSNYICSGQTAYYSVANLPGVSNYLWETSSNLSIISGQGTNSIAVQATNNLGGYVKVIPGCGYNSRKRDIRNFYDLEIDGYDTACAQNGYTYNYSVPALSGASYNWSITNGTINYGQGTRFVNITLSPNSTDQTWLTLAVTGVCAYTIYEHKIISHGNPPLPEPQCFGYRNEPNYKNENNTIQAKEILLFPNPTNSNVTISWPSQSLYDFNLIDVRGRVVYNKKNMDEKQFIFNLENFQSGVYFVLLTTNTTTVVKRLIIK